MGTTPETTYEGAAAHEAALALTRTVHLDAPSTAALQDCCDLAAVLLAGTTCTHASVSTSGTVDLHPTTLDDKYRLTSFLGRRGDVVATDDVRIKYDVRGMRVNLHLQAVT